MFLLKNLYYFYDYSQLYHQIKNFFIHKEEFQYPEYLFILIFIISIELF